MTQDAAAVRPRWALLPLRAVVGIVFLAHAWQKLFVFGLDGTSAFMSQVGIPLPGVAAVVVTAVELLGGVAIFGGLFTRWAAALLAIDMAVAIVAVRLEGGFFNPNGVEFELTLLAACATLATLGPGGLALQQLIGRRSEPPA